MTPNPQFKQEYFGEFVNDMFYETTVHHRFRQGDKVKVKNYYTKYYGSLEFTVDGIEFTKESSTGEWRVMYQAPTHKDWVGEHKLELVERSDLEEILSGKGANK